MIYGIETSQEAAGPAGYAAAAVHFAGSISGAGTGTLNGTWLRIPSLSATNNGLYSLSVWVKGLVTLDNEGGKLFVHFSTSDDPQGVVTAFGGGTGNVLALQFFPGGTPQFQGCIKAGLLTSTVWHHILFSCDFTTATPHLALYVDGSLIPYTTGSSGNFCDSGTTISTPLNETYNGRDFVLGDDTSGLGPDFDIADAWLAPGVSLLSGSIIPQATRNLFIDPSTHKPVDPAGFPSSAILFTGDHTSFATNLGTGGAATLNGTLTNASTHP